MKALKRRVTLAVIMMAACLLLFQGTSSASAQISDYKKREMRAVWIASVTNIDWPSKKGLSQEIQKQEYIKLMDDVKDMGMNAVVVQIKPTADAFYPSEYGPWSEYLTGIQGKDPGYNPLEFMLEEAHKRNLEFHAWFNPYRITMPGKTDINKLSADHPARQHPDWVIKYGTQLYYNPGIPEARKFIEDGVLEVVRNYDIDAVHMDDYFYPYRIAGQEFPDADTFAKYGNDFISKDDWRRDNVNVLVRDLNAAIKQEKPYVKFGISPFGVWRNIANDPTGSNTTAGQTNYDDLFADTREWIDKGYIDYITPQIYWNIGFQPAAYDILLQWWVNETFEKNVHLYIGQADYKIHANNAAWENPEELPNQIHLNRTQDSVMGSMHFSLKDIKRNPLGIKDRLKNDLYSQPAIVPVMEWLNGKAPKKPKLRDAQSTENGIQLLIEDHKQNADTSYFAVYRFDGKEAGDIETNGLLATVRKTGSKQLYVDSTAEIGKTYTYVLTALDRLHNESGYNREITVKAK